MPMLSRRDFLRTSTHLTLAPTVPAFLAHTARAAQPQRDGRVLVVIELNGGNDGINTVVPFADDGYAKHRPTLRLPAGQLLKVSDQVGLHPALRDAAKLLESNCLTVVQEVGYPNPNRSHFASMAIWQTARLRPEKDGLGWLGGALDGGPSPADGSPASVLVGLDAPPRALRGQRSVSAALAHLDDLVLGGSVDPKRSIQEKAAGNDLKAFVRRSVLDAYTTADRLKSAARVEDKGAAYPGTALAGRLRLVARLLKAGFGTRVFFTIQAGYDTHYAQLVTHEQLLAELGGAVRAFLDDLAGAKLADRVAVLVFSEFGRTVPENGSAGTDHGTAGPVFLAGPRVNGGLVGKTPSLTDLDPKHGDLKVSIDFRQVYASVLQDWLGFPAEQLVGRSFERLLLFRT
jgi:uncharacterized protein (DUF1501 family)